MCECNSLLSWHKHRDFFLTFTCSPRSAFFIHFFLSLCPSGMIFDNCLWLNFNIFPNPRPGTLRYLTSGSHEVASCQPSLWGFETWDLGMTLEFSQRELTTWWTHWMYYLTTLYITMRCLCSSINKRHVNAELFTVAGEWQDPLSAFP